MSSAREIMAKSGPEDVFAAVPDDKKIEGAPTTGGRRWNMGVPTEIEKMLSGFDFPSIEDFDRLMLNALRTNKARTGTGDLYRQLDGDRNLCTKPRFNLQFCLRERLAHQQSDCAPARAEVIKCRVKVARAVDMLCRKELVEFQACRDKTGAAAAPECLAKKLAWDQCTEEF